MPVHSDNMSLFFKNDPGKSAILAGITVSQPMDIFRIGRIIWG